MEGCLLFIDYFERYLDSRTLDFDLERLFICVYFSWLAFGYNKTLIYLASGIAL
jgi:hypothetical protein